MVTNTRMKWKVRGYVVHKNPGAASLSLWRAEEALRSDFSIWEGNDTLGRNLKLAGQWELTLNALPHQFGENPFFLVQYYTYDYYLVISLQEEE